MLEIVKHTVTTRNDANNRINNNKGTIGDRRSRSTLPQSISSNTVSDQKSFLLNQVLSGSGYNKDSVTTTYSQHYSNFNGTYNSPIQNMLRIDGKLPNGDSPFQSLYNQNYNSSNYLPPTAAAKNLRYYQSFPTNSMKTPSQASSSFYNNGSSLFAQGLNGQGLRSVQNDVDSLYFTSTDLGQQSNNAVPSSAIAKFWNGNSCLDGSALKSDSAVDTELSWAMESKLKPADCNVRFLSLYE